MKCEDVRAQLIDVFQGDVAPAPPPEVKRHIVTCTTCRNEFQELERIWSELGALTPPQLNPERAAAIARVLDDAAGQTVQSETNSRHLWLRRVTAIAALIVAALGGALLSRTSVALEMFPIQTSRTEIPGESFFGSQEAGAGTYLFLLHRPNRVLPPNRGQRYQQWADTLRASNQLVRAGALDLADGWLLSGPREDMNADRLPFPNGDIEGFFLISARDSMEVIEAARISPHFDYGGVIEVRRVLN